MTQDGDNVILIPILPMKKAQLIHSLSFDRSMRLHSLQVMR